VLLRAVLVLKVLIYFIKTKSDTKASGAGATGMLTQIATKNHLQLGTGKRSIV
jgi:hypothetical protein